ncbi:MAG: hypothetical protein A2Y78_00230 [Acidobacteria bacterium RBG_13_68_16]|nr:MAG: hypothetical protein A2Y78_00230 [Acidobacteria bacterium RBG_13_68_16]
MAYAVTADLYDHGVPRGSVPRTARLVASVDTATNRLELDGHGFAGGDAVTFRAEGGGSLPGGLTAGVTYYALPVDEAYFQVAATSGGSAIDLTTAGSRILVIPPSPIPAALDWASALIDDMLPAHVVPLTAPYPPIVVMTCAELAAWKVLAQTGAATASLDDVTKAAQERLVLWSKGAPIRGTNAPAAASLATSAAAPRTGSAWSSYGGIR